MKFSSWFSPALGGTRGTQADRVPVPGFPAESCSRSGTRNTRRCVRAGLTTQEHARACSRSLFFAPCSRSLQKIPPALRQISTFARFFVKKGGSLAVRSWHQGIASSGCFGRRYDERDLWHAESHRQSSCTACRSGTAVRCPGQLGCLTY